MSIEAMKQALEQIVNSAEFKIGNPAFEQKEAVLRQAIKKAEKQEQCLTCETLRYEIDALEAKIAELRKQAEKQEPVAIDWDAVHEKLIEVWNREMSADEGLDEIQGLIDTSPPPRMPWVGLTDVSEMVEAELTHYWNGEYADTTGARDQLTDFARVIEAKLKEKNT
jgi:hypothetical protein